MSDKFKNYEELREYLGGLPRTWYPDLLRAMVESIIKKEIFKPGKIQEFVGYIENPNKPEKNGLLSPIKAEVSPDYDDIQAALAWAEEHPKFDSEFLESLEKSCTEFGSLTPGQRQALDNIVDKWHIDLGAYS